MGIGPRAKMYPYYNTLPVMFKTFARRSVITFEEFLASASREAITDPGTAMVSVLRRENVPGIDVDAIVRDSWLNPQSNPPNILRFLTHIAERGQWGVNVSVVVD